MTDKATPLLPYQREIAAALEGEHIISVKQPLRGWVRFEEDFLNSIAKTLDVPAHLMMRDYSGRSADLDVVRSLIERAAYAKAHGKHGYGRKLKRAKRLHRLNGAEYSIAWFWSQWTWALDRHRRARWMAAVSARIYIPDVSPDFRESLLRPREPTFRGHFIAADEVDNYGRP